MCEEKHPFDFPNNTDLSTIFNGKLMDANDTSCWQIKFNFHNSKFFDWGKFDSYDTII